MEKATRSHDAENQQLARIRAILEYTSEDYKMVQPRLGEWVTIPELSKDKCKQSVALYDELMRRLLVLEREEALAEGGRAGTREKVAEELRRDLSIHGGSTIGGSR